MCVVSFRQKRFGPEIALAALRGLVQFDREADYAAQDGNEQEKRGGLAGARQQLGLRTVLNERELHTLCLRNVARRLLARDVVLEGSRRKRGQLVRGLRTRAGDQHLHQRQRGSCGWIGQAGGDHFGPRVDSANFPLNHVAVCQCGIDGSQRRHVADSASPLLGETGCAAAP